MKMLTFHFSAGPVVRFNVEDEEASALFGQLGRAWNEQAGVMYTLILGPRTHYINLSLVTGVDVE